MMHPKYRQLVIVLSFAACLFYLAYRVLFTLNLTTPYAVCVSVFLYLGEFYGVIVLGLFFLQVWDSREPPQQPILDQRTLDVFVPTYNEDPQMLRATLEACSRLDYPHKTYLCDDGGTEARLADPEKGPAAQARAEVLKKMCIELGAIYMPRPDNRHAKAGNLNHAFEKTDGEFIIILDADHVPEPHFISRLIGYFHDERLGFVQTPHAFYNFDSFQARLDHKNRRYWEEGHLFYEVIQPGRNRWGCPIFAGSAAMFRRQALKEVGYIAVETITEDMHTGMRVNARGWKSLAISERLVAGQAAPDVTTFHSQRIRWGEGNLSIMAHDNPLTMKGLRLAQRFCYLGSMVHWAGGLFKLAIYLTPILMMFTGVPPVAEFTWTLAIVTFVYLFASIYGVRVASNGYGSFFNGELFCMVNFWTQIQGTMKALFWRKFQQFIVTSKRGRQAKTIWPYVRPQVALLGLSVLALFWGWYKVLVGVSDDFFKPIIPTFWVLFHVVLAFMVLRRALWPEDQRFSTRHFVQLVAGYETRGVDMDGKAVGGGMARGLGITVDLNEMGVGLIAYEPLPVGALVRLTLRGAGEVVDCMGEVRWRKDGTPLGSRGVVQPGGYRHGIAFRDLSPQQMDVLNHMTLHYAVPRLYSEFAQGKQRTFWRRLGSWLAEGVVHRRTAVRRQVRLPLVLDIGQPGAAYSVTEDVARTAMSALLTTPPTPGAEVHFRLATPLGEVEGRARILRGEQRHYAAKVYWLWVFEFLHFADQGRVTLEMVLNPREHPHLAPILNPRKETLPVPMARHVGVGLAAAFAMVVVALGCFHYLHRDNLFLRDIAMAERPITEEEVDRVESIFKTTLAQTYPSTDRLLLLMGAMRRVNRPREVDQVTMVLAPRDRRNLDLQFTLAQILDNTKDYPRAEAEYQHLLKELEAGNLPASRKRDLLLGAARASVHAGNVDRACQRFRELLQSYPGNAAIRNEFAGVLMGARQFAKAAQVYQGAEPDLNGRLLLVAIHTQSKNLAAAERECRTIVHLRPSDAQAKLLLADVLSWKKGGIRQSRAIYEQLLQVNAGRPDLLIRLAQVALWNRSYDEALERFQVLIDRRLHNPEIVKGYINAAASAERVGKAQHRAAVAIYEHALTGMADDVLFLTRLAWVLQRVQEPDKSAVLLERALELNPKDADARRQLLGSLLASGRFKNRLSEFEGKELDFDTRQVLVHAYVRHNNFASAASQCRNMLKLRPNDPHTLRQLADILSWNKQYPESLELFGRLARAKPGDPEIALRQAEVTLWSGDCQEALARFQALLETGFDQPQLWSGYAAAAANAKSLNASHRRMLLRIYDASGAADVRDALFLARLAWALGRLKEGDRGRVLLDRAVALRPKEPAARKELAGVLAAVGQNKEALQMYKGLSLNRADRCRLAVLYAAEKDFAAAEKQCRAILKETPDDRQALRQLADVLSWNKQYREALALLERLAGDNPQDVELPVRLAEVLLWSGAYDKALAGFQKLLEIRFHQPQLWIGFVNAAASATRLSDRQAVLALRIHEQLAGRKTTNEVVLARLAWVMLRLKKTAQAGVLLDRAVALQPREAAARKELAGVLAATGRNQQALGFYQGVPLDLADRYRLADLHAAGKDFGAAAEQLRAILKAKPGDPKALRQLADVLSWKKDYRDAKALLEKLVHDNPQDTALAVRLAEVALWGGDHAGALARFEVLLAARFDQPKLWPGFVDAAAGAAQLNEAQAALAVRICDRVVTTCKETIFLARLAWVMQRLKESVRAAAVLDRAAALQPREPAVRKELAGILAAVGKNKAALRMYKGLPLDLPERYRLAGLYAADKNFTAAEQQCRAILQEKPKDTKARRLLAAVLSWKKDYPAALALLQQLAGDDPANVEMPVRLAEVMVWSGDYEHALPRLEALLAARFEQPDLWASFVNAAASAPRLTGAQTRLALRIYERTAAAKSTDVPLLARLAWLLYRAKQAAKAGTLLDQALALRPKETGVRRELAGTLAAVRRFKDALKMYEGIKLDVDDRYHLIGIYATALRQSQEVLEDKPDDTEAKQLSAYVLSWQQIIRESLVHYEKLAGAAPRDRRLQVRLAEVTLWSRDFDKALNYFQALLHEQPDQPQLWQSYVDAAASSTVTLTDAHRATALRIYRGLSTRETRVEYLSRLAWVLHRLKDTAKVNRLLDRALALLPTEPAVRKELAGMLATAGRHRQARNLYAGLKLTITDLYRLVEIDVACGDIEAGEKKVRAILKLKPNDLKARLLLASVLCGGKRFLDAAQVYRDLLRDYPEDSTIPIKIAELALGGGDYDTALAQFQKLLDRDMKQPALWKEYIDAAASAKKLPESAHRTIMSIFDKTRTSRSGDAVFLTRLAWVLRRVQEPAKSIVLLEKVLAMDPGDRTIRLQLAETLYETGDYQKAEQHFKVLLKK